KLTEKYTSLELSESMSYGHSITALPNNAKWGHTECENACLRSIQESLFYGHSFKASQNNTDLWKISS
ncbi:hypothetical protein P7K49_019311, partial [Saguinus oedipus]